MASIDIKKYKATPRQHHFQGTIKIFGHHIQSSIKASVHFTFPRCKYSNFPSWLSNAKSWPFRAGEVIGSGSYQAGEEIAIKAEPEESLQLIKWVENGHYG